VQIENRDTIVAEKLINPITINEIKTEGHSGVYREEEFLDPFLDAEKTEGNYNTEKKNPFGQKKKTKDEERIRQLEVVVFKDASLATLIDDLRLRIEEGEAMVRKEIA
jgi:hypothetical protein